MAKKNINLNAEEIKQLESLIYNGSNLTDGQLEQISAGINVSPKIVKALMILGAVGTGAIILGAGYKLYSSKNSDKTHPQNPDQIYTAPPLNIPATSPLKSALKNTQSGNKTEKKVKKHVRFNKIVEGVEYEKGSVPDIHPYE